MSQNMQSSIDTFMLSQCTLGLPYSLPDVYISVHIIYVNT